MEHDSLCTAQNSAREMAWNVFASIVAWLLGIVLAVAFGAFLSVLGYRSPFHSHAMSVFLIFGIPCVLGQVVAFSITLKGNEDSSWIAGKTALAILLLSTTLFSRMVFTITYNLIFGILGWYAARKTFSSEIIYYNCAFMNFILVICREHLSKMKLWICWFVV